MEKTGFRLEMWRNSTALAQRVRPCFDLQHSKHTKMMKNLISKAGKKGEDRGKRAGEKIEAVEATEKPCVAGREARG